jgi:pimeloyl-ACP methyl ester carboxylesterase
MMVMPMDGVIERFARADTDGRLEIARDDRNRQALSAMLGEEAYAELRSLAKRAAGAYLAGGGPKNLIFVPGVMGTLLMNRSLAGIWWIDVRTREYIDRLKLSPDGTKDADEASDVAPATADITYFPFLTAASARDGVYHQTFPYDWRKSFLHSTIALRDRVLELHQNSGKKKIDIVAHSMGGLMVRTALMEHGAAIWPAIGKIVFVGTPHYGATAIAGYLKNHLWGFDLMALLGRYLSRETLRSLWGVLSLLPAPRGIYPGTRPDDPHPWKSGAPDDPYVHPCANFDMYDARAWKLELDDEATKQLQTVLDAAADLHRCLYKAHNALDQEKRDKMIVIAGVGYKTLFRLAYAPAFLGMWEKTAKTFDLVPNDPHRQGDGRVPLASALLENVGDIRYVRGVHGGLTNIPAVYDDIFRCLRGETMTLPKTAAGALSSHLAGGSESEAPHLDGSHVAPEAPDDPRLWDLAHPPAERMQELTELLESDRLPAFARLHLL